MPRASRPATKSAAAAGVARREPAPAYSTLIGTADLARHLGDAAFVIVDVRHDLANPDSFGVDAYANALTSAIEMVRAGGTCVIDAHVTPEYARAVSSALLRHIPGQKSAP